eukprot:jgi/Botrbrau1/14166/Bobra.182_3s0104.3
MTWALGVLVPFQLYEGLGEWGYMAVGLCAGLPCFVLPLLLDPKADRQKPFLQKYWVKANLWIAIFSFIGNYFWTHYFYQLLGAQYTFPAHNLNGVPIALYFMTHAYFCFYHTLSNVLIRRTLRATETYGKHVQGLAAAALVFCLAYATAFMETLTIAHFPYYTFKVSPPCVVRSFPCFLFSLYLLGLGRGVIPSSCSCSCSSCFCTERQSRGSVRKLWGEICF